MVATKQILVRVPQASRYEGPLAVRLSVLFAAGILALSGCAGEPFVSVIKTSATHVADQLVPFTSCGDALRHLRMAASSAVTAGFAVSRSPGATGGLVSPGSPAGPAGPARAAQQAPAAGLPGAAGQAGADSGAGSAAAGAIAAPGSYSQTNTATAGVDEPDLVKTDGRRIVTVIGGVLRVVDAQTMRLTGVLDLSGWAGPDGAAPVNLLLAGNHALVLFDQANPLPKPPVPGVSGAATGTEASSAQITGPDFLLIDLSAATPRVVSQYTIDGALVDARQVGSVARVVIHSAPRVFLPAGYGLNNQQRVTADRAVISRTPLSAWLPRYAVTDGQVQRSAVVDCASVSHPAASGYSGTSMITVLTFDLNAASLGDGLPVTIVADGDTVYSNGASLYIANDRQWSMPQNPGPATMPPDSDAQSAGIMPQQYAAVYKFGIARRGRPVYEASGTVPGWLLGSAGTAQYALSEWNGALRVATTTGLFGWSGPPPRSAVYVLEQVGSQLVIVGKVGGLGSGDQIYAVRFVGPAGYVVTYRSVDPLYTLDLSDPAQPRVVGELRLSGYSAYLDPIDASHVIGIGQATNAAGHIEGTQISLFDTSDLAAPVRTAVFRLPFGHSEAEIDPHALLYWPPAGLLVIPVQLPDQPVTPPPGSTSADNVPTPVSAALVLHISDQSITETGLITHPAVTRDPARGQIRRSLVIGNDLWTLCDQGLKANDLMTLTPLGWVPFG
jgi:Beta propeller domain